MSLSAHSHIIQSIEVKIMLTIRPAYARYYNSQKAIKESWQKNEDFEILTFSVSGTYLNRIDYLHQNMNCDIQVRYGKDGMKVMVLTAKFLLSEPKQIKNEPTNTKQTNKPKTAKKTAARELSFTQWLDKIDGITKATIGLNTDEMVDIWYEQYYQGGFTPQQIAKVAIENHRKYSG